MGKSYESKKVNTAIEAYPGPSGPALEGILVSYIIEGFMASDIRGPPGLIH